MIKFNSKLEDYQAYLACDHCGKRLDADAVFITLLGAGEEPTGKVLMLHQACREYVKLDPGHYISKPARGVILDIAGNLRVSDDATAEAKRRERRQRAIIKVAYSAGSKGFTVRDVMRNYGSYDSYEVRQHLADLVAIGVLQAEDAKDKRGAPQTRYYADRVTLDAALLARV